MLFRKLLQDARARGATLIINSHQLDEVERVCDRVAFVSGGKVQSIETPRAGAELTRVIVVRWAASTPVEAIVAMRLQSTAADAGARWLDTAAASARFSVSDDDEPRLLQRLFGAGVRVVEAVPEAAGSSACSRRARRTRRRNARGDASAPAEERGHEHGVSSR
jgi:ABC-2 type transport system ATP-binding protein